MLSGVLTDTFRALGPPLCLRPGVLKLLPVPLGTPNLSCLSSLSISINGNLILSPLPPIFLFLVFFDVENLHTYPLRSL